MTAEVKRMMQVGFELAHLLSRLARPGYAPDDRDRQQCSDSVREWDAATKEVCDREVP